MHELFAALRFRDSVGIRMDGHNRRIYTFRSPLARVTKRYGLAMLLQLTTLSTILLALGINKEPNTSSYQQVIVVVANHPSVSHTLSPLMWYDDVVHLICMHGRQCNKRVEQRSKISSKKLFIMTLKRKKKVGWTIQELSILPTLYITDLADFD